VVEAGFASQDDIDRWNLAIWLRTIGPLDRRLPGRRSGSPARRAHVVLRSSDDLILLSVTARILNLPIPW
jgi:hypothetical protein